MGTGTYKANVKCENCKRTAKVYIEKGTSVDEFIKNNICKYCGCKQLIKCKKYNYW